LVSERFVFGREDHQLRLWHFEDALDVSGEGWIYWCIPLSSSNSSRGGGIQLRGEGDGKDLEYQTTADILTRVQMRRRGRGRGGATLSELKKRKTIRNKWFSRFVPAAIGSRWFSPSSTSVSVASEIVFVGITSWKGRNQGSLSVRSRGMVCEKDKRQVDLWRRLKRWESLEDDCRGLRFGELEKDQ
jgi:hypothetical protein